MAPDPIVEGAAPVVGAAIVAARAGAGADAPAAGRLARGQVVHGALGAGRALRARVLRRVGTIEVIPSPRSAPLRWVGPVAIACYAGPPSVRAPAARRAAAVQAVGAGCPRAAVGRRAAKQGENSQRKHGRGPRGRHRRRLACSARRRGVDDVATRSRRALRLVPPDRLRPFTPLRRSCYKQHNGIDPQISSNVDGLDPNRDRDCGSYPSQSSLCAACAAGCATKRSAAGLRSTRMSRP